MRIFHLDNEQWHVGVVVARHYKPWYKPAITCSGNVRILPLLMDANDLERFKVMIEKIPDRPEWTYDLFQQIVAGAARVAVSVRMN